MEEIFYDVNGYEVSVDSIEEYNNGLEENEEGETNE